MVKCCVEGCNGPYSKDITYFNFPVSKVLRRKWIAAISPLVKPKLGSMVCSRHFPSEDCESARGRTRLRAGAVPSLFDQTKRQRTDSSSSDSTPIINLKSKPVADAEDTTTEEKGHQNDEEDIAPNDVTPVDNKIDKVKAKTKKDLKRKNLHDKLKDLHEKKGSLQNKEIEQTTSNADNVTDKTDSKDTKDDSEDKSEDLKDKADKMDSSDSLISTENDNLKDKIDSLQNKDSIKDKDDDLKTKDGEERVQEKSGSEKKEEAVQALAVKEKDVQPHKSGDSQDKCKESTPVPPSTRDIDKPEDIEDLLTNYHIPTDRSISKREAPEPTDQQPVFIEISVDKDNSGCEAGKSDCLMVMESVQVELDPSELMLDPSELMEPETELETVEVDDTPLEKGDPISLLTSSDEDDVIIEEPHIDTVEVSDETDEDDMPLVKLLKRRRADKKKEITEDTDTDFAKILWGMYEYYCVQCHYTTSSGIEYRKHTASHAKVLMMCQICGYMTASEGQFTKHEKQHGEKKYKCHLCSYKAKHNMSLLYHLKGHKAEDFLKNANLGNVGVVKVPRRGKLFSCGRCPYATNKRSDLTRHKARRHMDEDEDFVP